MLEPGQGKDDAQEAKDEAAGDEGDHGRQVHGKAVKGEGDAEDQEPLTPRRRTGQVRPYTMSLIVI